VITSITHALNIKSLSCRRTIKLTVVRTDKEGRHSTLL
jgi:hypothetical protein